jgi:T-complex protein 1 subunit alpha
MSSALQSASGASSAALAINGERLTGASVREFNNKAAQTLANLLKSSLGPLGLDKMLVDAKGDDVNITNDGATILSLLDVGHPAARLLAELARQQDEDVGDGTTTVVILAAELVKRASELIRRQRLHPTTVISGLRLACKEAVRFVEDQVAQRTELLGRQTLLNCARTALSSKVISGDFFAQLAVDAILAVKCSTSSGVDKYPIKAVNVLKAHGRSVEETVLITQGYALNCTVACEGMPKSITGGGVRIACLDVGLQRTRLPQGATVCVVDDPGRLEAVRQREIGQAVERVRAILRCGASVLLTTKGIDDLCLKMFVEAGCMAVRRVKLEDLRRIAKACGATVVSSFAPLDGGSGEEVFDGALLGYAESVAQERFGDDECLVLRGLCAPPNSSNSSSSANASSNSNGNNCASVILRGPNAQMLDEAERALHDALCVLKSVLEHDGTVVPGGGAVETALSVFLENFATTIASREQLAVAEFGEALLVIPRTLALNAGLDASDLVARLRSRHYAAQSALGQRALRHSGLVLTATTTDAEALQDCIEAGVVEPTAVKVRALQSATEAAVALLRIDDYVKVLPSSHGADQDD